MLCAFFDKRVKLSTVLIHIIMVIFIPKDIYNITTRHHDLSIKLMKTFQEITTKIKIYKIECFYHCNRNQIHKPH